MRNNFSIALSVMFLAASGLCARAGAHLQRNTPQEPPRREQAAQPTPPSPATTAQSGFRIRDGTPVKLRLRRTVTSVDAEVGDRVDFEVVEPVKVGEVEVISKGAAAWGIVGVAERRGRLGKGGKLVVNIEGTRLVTGEKVPLSAANKTQGSAVGTVVGTTAVLGPIIPYVAPLMLLRHGDDVVIPKGTQITAYVQGDMNLDPGKFGRSTGP